MKEIMLRGPVEAAFMVHEDFLQYKSGVYFHAWGAPMSGHAIRILGYCKVGDVPYWLIANSWNEDWCEKGYVRFLRGCNECRIEDDIVAGLPYLPTIPQYRYHDDLAAVLVHLLG
ncbi:hypothetical protein CRM22_003844 [Opisthorchis felineus]|uniref:Peptidase C1A papain C-terminal domain-containing protein n=1 Tax=Opisthorchis felineus TaxID=147828 RepID=A0A4S2LZ88_OPIFE|nr:hypothetical protein CRM22_003844 [Opisthorchis felineus]